MRTHLKQGTFFMKSNPFKKSLVAGISLAALISLAACGSDSNGTAPEESSSSKTSLVDGDDEEDWEEEEEEDVSKTKKKKKSNTEEEEEDSSTKKSSNSKAPEESSESKSTVSSSTNAPVSSSTQTVPSSSSKTVVSSSSAAVITAGTDILNGKGEFTKNGQIIEPNATDYSKLGVFNVYRWDGAGDENGLIRYIKNDDEEAVLEFYPTKNNAHIYDIQLEKDITIKKGYSYQIMLEGYDYGTHRNIHVGIQSLRGASGTSYENYISDDGSYWNTASATWKSGKALVCQTKTAQFYINAGGKNGEGLAIKSLKIIETAMPAGICDDEVTGTDILNGKGEFTKNNQIIEPNATDYSKLGVFNVYRWDGAGDENGLIRYIKNDDEEVVLEFYPSRNNANISDIQLEKDISIKAGYAYQIVVSGYDYGTSRNIHVGIQSLFDEANPTSYENYISDEGSFWNTATHNWRSGKALVCQNKTAQFYVNAGGKKGEGLAIKSIQIFQQAMPAGICN